MMGARSATFSLLLSIRIRIKVVFPSADIKAFFKKGAIFAFAIGSSDSQIEITSGNASFSIMV